MVILSLQVPQSLSKRLQGQFCPISSISSKNCSFPTGMMLTLSSEVSLSQNFYSYDRNISNHFHIANPKDFIEVKFDTTTIDNLQGLHCYMNTLVSNNDDLQRVQIRKVSYFWGYHESNFISCNCGLI